MVKPKIFEMGEKCFICELDKWVGNKFNNRYMLLTGTHRDSGILGFKTGEYTNYMWGVSCEDKHICLMCFEILVGLEDY
jgi:hypothetical protein